MKTWILNVILNVHQNIWLHAFVRFTDFSDSLKDEVIKIFNIYPASKWHSYFRFYMKISGDLLSQSSRHLVLCPIKHWSQKLNSEAKSNIQNVQEVLENFALRTLSEGNEIQWKGLKVKYLDIWFKGIELFRYSDTKIDL